MTQRAALLRRHDDRKTFKVVLMQPGQSEAFDTDSATRNWLWPHLGTEWHLSKFIDVEVQS